MGLRVLRRGRAMRAAFVLTTFALAGGVLVGATAAAADVTVTTAIPFEVTGDDPCTLEPLAGTGYEHFLIGGNFSNGGMAVSHIEANLQGVQAVGLVTGAKYVAVDSSSQSFVLDLLDAPPAPFHFTSEEVAEFVRQGEVATAMGGDDFFLHVLTHATVNANGTVTVDDFSTDMRCK